MKTFTIRVRCLLIVLALPVLFVASNAHAHCKVYHPHHCSTIGSLPTDSIAYFQDQLISNKRGRCLDVAGGRNVNGANVQLFDCNGSRSQRWSYDVKLKRIRNVMGRCLEVAGGVFANRTNIQLYDCNGSKAQKWTFNITGEIRNDKKGRCLEVAGGVFANRTNIQLYDCNGTASQKWQKTKRSYRSPGRIN